MNVRRLAIGTAAVAALAAGAVGAIAAVGGGDARKTEDSVLADAAKRLGVSPQDLRSALGAAEDAQLQKAVEQGRLTQAQADELKARRRDSGRVLGLGHGDRHGGFLGRGPGHGPGNVLGAAAKALGLSERRLLAQLRDGMSLADVAKARGKDVADVKAAIKAAVREDLDAAVKAKRITDAQRDHMLSELDEHLDDLVQRGFPGPRDGHRFRGGPGPDGPGMP